VVNYGVRVNLDPTDASLRLDMTANASIIGEKHENVLAVPTTAIRAAGSDQTQTNGQSGANVQSGQTVTNTQSGQSAPRIQGNFVLVLQDGQPRPVQVTVGMTVGDLTEVSGDLQEGDLVLVGTVASSQSSTNTDQGGDFPGGPPDGGVPLDGGAPPDGGGGPPAP